MCLQTQKIFYEGWISVSQSAPDKRTVRTKKLLREALLDLTEEKGLEKITVSDLTSRAEINRGTFYLHYKDVRDLYEQFMEEVLAGWSEIGRNFDFLEVLRCEGKNEPYPGLVAVFEYCNRNARFCSVILGPNGDPTFARHIQEMMKERILSKLSLLNSNYQDAQLKVPPDYVMAYMTSANVGLIRHWFETGQQQSPRDLAMIMTRIVTQGPLAALGISRSN